MIGNTEFQATARLEPDGTAKVKVTATTEYGTRKAGVTEEVTDGDILAAAEELLGRAIRSVQKDLQPKSVVAAAEAFVYAAKQNEEL